MFGGTGSCERSMMPRHVLIDLEFDTSSQAEALLAAMRRVWGQVDGKIISGPVARIVEEVETKVY